MLRVYDRNIEATDGLSIENDAEKLFSMTKLNGTHEERKLNEVIEKGSWNDDSSFIDRFGFKLPIDDLSTGCKAALAVLNHPEIVLDTIECGVNAVDAMFCLCKNGSIIADLEKVSFEDEMASQIEGGVDICINGLRIYDINYFVRYVNDFYWVEPEEIEPIEGVVECLR